MAKRKKKSESYDYQLLAKKPKIFGFFVGWFGQGLLNRVYVSASWPTWVEPRAGWDLCVMDLYRLGAMVGAWSTVHRSDPSSQLIERLRGVARLCGPEGYAGTPEGVKGTGLLLRRDASPTSLPGCETWPDVLDVDTPFPGEFGALVREIHSLVTMIGELASQQNAAAAGAALCRLVFGDVSSDTNPEPYPWLKSLVNLGLLPAPRGYKKAPWSKKGVVTLENLKKTRKLESELDVLRDIPLVVCGHASLPCPPTDSDLKKSPAFSVREPADVEPTGTKKTGAEPKPRPAKSAGITKIRLTLREFIKHHCEVVSPKMSSELIDSRVNSLLAAARRGEVELPPHQENWRNGQSKKYLLSDLKRMWPELRQEWPGLPALKK